MNYKKKEFKDVVELVKNHECDNRVIVPNDDTKSRTSGWICIGCNKSWSTK
jgi:hypothetical protein